MSNITYIFTSGRADKLNDKNYADDFFYGLRHLNKKFNVEIIEFKKKSKLLINIEHILSKAFSLPFYIFSLISLENIKKIKNSDKLILISESTAFAVLPILLFLKKKKNIQVYLFVMGLYSKKLNYKFTSFIHHFLIKFLYKYVDKLFFLGNAEYGRALKLHGDERKLYFRPFCIDVSFWTTKNKSSQTRKKILFIGNDGNRDFDLLISIASIMQDFKFTFVSSSSKLDSCKLTNVEIIKGDWSNGKFNDFFIKDIYEESGLVILPLINSYQPSGQSVALQAMSMEKPVMISKTKGFWSDKDFQHNLNIIFINSWDSLIWKNSILYYFENYKLIDNISTNSCKLVYEKYNLEYFNKQLIKDLGLLG